jgi:hypothetical protein
MGTGTGANFGNGAQSSRRAVVAVLNLKNSTARVVFSLPPSALFGGGIVATAFDPWTRRNFTLPSTGFQLKPLESQLLVLN